MSTLDLMRGLISRRSKVDISIAFFIFFLASVYASISLIALYEPEWFPELSILQMIFIGPPILLIWGTSILPLYWLFTVSIFCLMLIGIMFKRFRLFAIFIIVPVWLSAGLFSTAMSI